MRGALGYALREVACAEDYGRIFEPPPTAAGPSGLSRPPRPFVIRAKALEGRTLQPGERFCFDLHLFDTRNPVLEHFAKAFAQWADLVSVQHAEVAVDLDTARDPVSSVRVEFQTPTELKSSAGGWQAEFSVLLARARDRISTLRSLYGEGPLEIDFHGLAERAQAVKTVRGKLRRIALERRSSRTGQHHDIGGVVGFAEYEGDLTEFLPYLEAAHWTGVGRHCTWGNGQIQTKIPKSEF